jgi:hypothetical protein
MRVVSLTLAAVPIERGQAGEPGEEAEEEGAHQSMMASLRIVPPASLISR